MTPQKDIHFGAQLHIYGHIRFVGDLIGKQVQRYFLQVCVVNAEQFTEKEKQKTSTIKKNKVVKRSQLEKCKFLSLKRKRKQNKTNRNETSGFICLQIILFQIKVIILQR